jgi:hypothetical protein
MIDELRGGFALGFAHRFENARLRDSAEIILDRRPPPGFDHIEANRLRQPIGLGDAMLNAGDGWT